VASPTDTQETGPLTAVYQWAESRFLDAMRAAAAPWKERAALAKAEENR
jgi:hypothetical protein